MIDPVRAKVIARYIKTYGHEPYPSDEEDVKEWVNMLNAHAAELTTELHGRIEELLDVIESANNNTRREKEQTTALRAALKAGQNIARDFIRRDVIGEGQRESWEQWILDTNFLLAAPEGQP